MAQAEDVSHEAGLDRIEDAKGPATEEAHKEHDEPKRCSLLDGNTSDTSATGQVDEQEWKTDMIHKTPSDLDRLAASATATATDSNNTTHPNVVHSRLLTKKQLGEMAWGVRELSRRLGSIRLRFRVKTIFLLTKIHDDDLILKARALTRWLLDKDRDVRYVVYVEKGLRENREFDAAGLLEEVRKGGDSDASAGVDSDGKKKDETESADLAKRLRVWDEHMCRVRPHTFDFVITLGGDGTVLYASWLFQRIVPPVLSFALGSLGFLTKFDFADFEKTLVEAFNKGVSVSLRLRFEGTVMRSRKRNKPKRISAASGDVDAQDKAAEKRRDLVDELIGEEKDDERTHLPDGTYEVLNEIVLDRGPNPTMSEIEIFGDDEHFTTVMADGVCVSTPTGSTAYNLAAGGSLCHPENPVMLLTGISPHTLSFRPIILPDTIVLRLGVPYNARTGSWASFDGRERVELCPGDYVTISASRYPFANVQTMHGRRSEDWINSISAKLAWNSRSRQKAYKEWEK